ncbi:hypothetical protein [Kordiimonas sp. SCSIO 12610]|uniref:TolB family protein n=1 Tax=Kordiimonas sp. SCSIO 12610 TaxID=2829597 RepID=UPI0021093D6F|nr:hypothetical protein [Kordiimonas sp. SCSIO 12610]UTW54108.1 PD40 domain-containing protein [Kordiimonas sp. SCSIO 12610]
MAPKFKLSVFAITLSLLPSTYAYAQQTPASTPNNVGAPPETEIYLANLMRENGILKTSNVKNASNHKGYDNQPYFTKDSQHFLFVSEGAEQRMDIWQYSVKDGAKTQITNNHNNSEYSPKLIPDGSGYSVIKEKENRGGQQVWKYPFTDTAKGAPIIDISPVGYHAWGVGTQYLAVFALGNPSTLRLVERESQKEEIIFENIGRALYALPDGSGYMFTERRENEPFMIHHLDIKSRKVSPVFDLPGNNEHYNLMIDDNAPLGVRFISGNGSKLYERKIGDDSWTEFADLSESDLKNISRLAISPDGKYIAVVNGD